MAIRKQFCPRGHDKLIVGVEGTVEGTKNTYCRQCRRESQRVENMSPKALAIKRTVRGRANKKRRSQPMNRLKDRTAQHIRDLKKQLAQEV